MFNFALIIILAGFMILVGLSVWVRLRQDLGKRPEVEQAVYQAATENEQTADEAVIVATEFGQLVFINEQARNWLAVRGGTPTLEYLTRNARPSDSLRELFIDEGRAAFQIGDRWVEGISHRIPHESEIRMVVTLRPVRSSDGSAAFDLQTATAIVNEISDTINASFGVDQVLQSILAIIRKYITDIDAGEICLYEADENVLYQRGWTGDAMYVLSLATAGGVYYPGEGMTGWIAQTREPLLVADVTALDARRPKLEDNPYASFIGVPLAMGEHFIGTLELVSKQPGRFGAADLALLQALARPVATAIYNAELYARQTRRIDDIASLQQVAQERDLASDVGSVYSAMNERIAQLAGAQTAGVLMYDEARQRLVGQPPFHGLPDSLATLISIPLDEDEAVQNIWQQEYWISNDLHDEPLIDAMELTPIVAAASLRNLVMLVMRIGQQPVGVMLVANKSGLGGFTNQDIYNLRILVAQAAIVVENIRLFQREQRQDTELIGLQEITHAIGALSSQDEIYLYSDINRRIASLMELQMCGILLYDAVGERLVAQLPFYGVPDEAIAGYEIDLGTNEVLYEIWDEDDYWFTNRAKADTVVFSAGLAELAERINVEKTLIAALVAGGRKIGAIQVSNKTNGADFNDNDARLLQIFATQAAAILENARLVREVRRRAQEAERLRAIAERAGSVVTLDETLAPVLSEVAGLTDSQLVYLSVINEESGALVTHPRAIFGAELDHAIRYDTETEGYSSCVAVAAAPFWSNNAVADVADRPLYQAWVQRLDIHQMLVVPLMIGERSLGEIGIANPASGTYKPHDLDIMGNVALQLASTIERVRLFEVAGQNLDRRVKELDAISRVSAILTETNDLDPILDVIRVETAKATGAEGSTIAILREVAKWDSEDEHTELAYRIGERDILRELADVERAVMSEPSRAIIIEDYDTSSLRGQPYGTYSAMAVVLTYANNAFGVLHLHDRRRGQFDERAISFLKTMAAKAALGYGNAVRFTEQKKSHSALLQRVEQLNQIFELGQILQTPDLDAKMMLEAIAYGVAQSAGFDVVVVAMVDEDTGLLQREVNAGLPVDVFEKSRAYTLPTSELHRLQQDEYRISESYFFPLEKVVHWTFPGIEAVSASYAGTRSIHTKGDNAWRDGDMLLVPISGVGGEWLGVLSLDRPQNNRRPDRRKIEIIEIFAHQAASTIENNRLYLNSVRSAEQEARLNEMLERIASTLDIDEIVMAVAHNAMRLAPFERMTVALKQDDANAGFEIIRLTVQHDDSLVTSRERKSSLDYTALWRTMKSGVDYVYTRQNDIAAYKDLAEWHQQGERVSLIIPLSSGGEMLGALHFGSSEETDFSMGDARQVLGRAAKLMAVAIQNARLFNQAVNLQVFNESVVESIQQGIVVLDRSGRVISANRFVQDVYGWDIYGKRKDIFEHSPDLANVLADDLRQVLETGEPHQILNLRTASELELDNYTVRNFYLYPLMSGEAVNGAVLLIEDVTERARLQENVEARANQLAALTRASSQITSSLQRDEVIQLALEAMREVVDYDTMTIWRREGADERRGEIGWMTLVGVEGVDIALSPPLRIPIENAPRMRRMVDVGTVMNVPNLPAVMESFNYTLPGDVGYLSWMGVPLVTQSEVVGMVAVTKREENAFGSQSEQAALAFANQVAVALTNAELFTETASRTERLSVLNRVSLALVQSMDSENIFEIALTEIAHALHAEKARAVIFDTNNAMGRVVVDHPRGDSTPTETFALDQRAIYRFIMSRLQPLVFSHNRANMPEPLDESIVNEIERRGLRDFLLIPMVAPGRIMGAFEFETRSGELLLDTQTLEIGLIIANQTAIAIQNANQLEETTLRKHELETLLKAAQSTTMTLDLQEVFKRVVDLFITSLDMQDCAIMILDYVENVLEVQIDVNRSGDPDRVSPEGTRFALSDYPLRERAMRNREVIVVRADDPDAEAAELRELEAQGDTIRMLVPLFARDNSIGLIQIESNDPHRQITEGERQLASAMGTQVAAAIDNARLQTETAAQMDELFIINELSQAISSTLDVESMLDIVQQQVPRVTEARELYVALVDADTDTIHFPLAVKQGQRYRIAPRKMGADEVSFIIRERRALNLGSDYFTVEEVRRSLGIENGEGDVKSYLGVPLVAGDEVLGVLAVRDEERTRVFGINDQRIMQTVGTQLGATLQNARLFSQIQNSADEMERRVDERTAELERERDRLDMLYQITAELALTLDMDRVLSRALQMIASAVKAHDGVIMLIDPMTDRLYNRASLSRSIQTGENERPTHPAEPLANWLVHNEHELLVDDLHEEDYWNPDSVEGSQWRSAMAVLLETNEDVQGAMILLSRDTAAFSEPELNLVIASANQVASAINNADLYQLIREQAERLGTLLRTEQEEAEKLNAILEGIADGVILTDSQGKINLFNSAAADILGLTNQQAMNRRLVDLVETYGERVLTWVQPIIDWTSMPDDEGRGLFPADRLEVGDRVVSVSIAPVYTSGEYLGAVSVFRDVTRDVEVDNLKNEFILNVTHEFRTPMTSIKGYAELLLLRGDMNGMPDEQREDITRIKNNADRLAALVEDLLTISKIDAGESPLAIEPVNIAELIDVQLTNARNRHYSKPIKVEKVIEPDLPRAALDRNKTMQIIANIIDNAFNYTPADGTITVRLQHDPERERHLLLTVADTGLGIPKAFQDKIWDRFARYDKHALDMDIPGTGLGLSIVRELVLMQGGDVWFDSQEGQGTSFFVTFPIEYRRSTSTSAANYVRSSDELLS